MPQNDPESAETAAARRLTDALAPSAIDALLADAKAAGTPIDGVDGLLNQMTKAVLERALQTEMTHHLEGRRSRGPVIEPVYVGCRRSWGTVVARSSLH